MICGQINTPPDFDGFLTNMHKTRIHNVSGTYSTRTSMWFVFTHNVYSTKEYSLSEVMVTQLCTWCTSHVHDLLAFSVPLVCVPQALTKFIVC